MIIQCFSVHYRLLLCKYILKQTFLKLKVKLKLGFKVNNVTILKSSNFESHYLRCGLICAYFYTEILVECSNFHLNFMKPFRKSTRCRVKKNWDMLKHCINFQINFLLYKYNDDKSVGKSSGITSSWNKFYLAWFSTYSVI